jgi:RecA-family ATPase
MQEYHGTFDEFVDRPGEINWVGGDAPRFKLMPFDELTPGTARRFLIKNILPRRGLILIWGAPKCGKSFWTFDAVMHVALGWEYRGLRVHQGPVVCCAFEGAEGFKARAEAFRQQHGLMGQRPPFYLTEAAMDLVQDQPALVASIKAQIGKVMPAVVVLDTLNRSLRGSESSDEDMANYVRAADAVQQAIECAVIVVHHCGHDGNRPRGHSALLGAVDAQIAISRDGVANIVATVERMKDGPEGATIASRLDQVTVGTDEDGDPITSCVTVEAEQAAAQERGPRL